MRDWDRVAGRAKQAGLRVLVLTADDPAALRKAVRAKALQASFVPVDQALWDAWGLANPKRERLPHPSTLLIGPDGLVLFAETHVDYSQRTPPADVLAFLEQRAAP